MDRTERFYLIDKLLSERRQASFAELLERLSVSPATLKRDLEYMRNRLGAPIVWDRDERAYRFEGRQNEQGGQYELPGLWFSASEIHALLTMQHLLSGIDSDGLLAPHIQPLMARLEALLGTADDTQQQLRQRVRILGMAARPLPLAHFAQIGSALLHRKRVIVRYHARSTDETSERELSPQRLVHYRDNWYLDAWCHRRNALRSFSMDGMRAAETLEKPAREIPARTLDAELGSGYGIFAGSRVKWATLRFSKERARWVAAENWHPRQRTRLDEDGCLLMELPFAQDRELVMDILKHGAQVEVLKPAALRAQVAEQARKTAELYATAAEEGTSRGARPGRGTGTVRASRVA